MRFLSCDLFCQSVRCIQVAQLNCCTKQEQLTVELLTLEDCKNLGFCFYTLSKYVAVHNGFVLGFQQGGNIFLSGILRHRNQLRSGLSMLVLCFK